MHSNSACGEFPSFRSSITNFGPSTICRNCSGINEKIEMISAAFIWAPGTYDEEFTELNAVIEAVAVTTPGFLGVENWSSEDGKRKNATYYWNDLDSLKALSDHPRHIEAKARYAQWYNGYHVVISEVVRSYGDSAFPHITPAAKSAA